MESRLSRRRWCSRTNAASYTRTAQGRTQEQRWHAIGAARIEHGAGAVLLVVHAYRKDYGGEEIIRIISARAAEKHEIGRYQEQAMD
jgi:uncharacterized DUF497 family protein